MAETERIINKMMFKNGLKNYIYNVFFLIDK